MEPIIIVGGGIGGLTMALALAKLKIPSVVLEQAPEFRELGAGIQLCPNVFKMFDYLGISQQMKDLAIFPDNLVYIDGMTGDNFLKISLKQELYDYFKQPYGVYHRVELLKGLYHECKKDSLIVLRASSKVVEVGDRAGHAFVKLENGEILEGPMVIGCDGLWSIVRQYVVGKEQPRFSGHVAHRGVVPLKKLPPELRPNDVVHWVRDDAHLVHYPIGTQGFFNIIAIYNTENKYENGDIHGKPEELHEKFKGSQQSILNLIKELDTTRMWMLYDRDPIKHWYKNRVVLLGDAAHPTLPYLTQGAGMAIEDAVVLSNKLASSKNDVEQAFQSYQNERYLRTGYVQLFSRAYGNSHHSKGVARELRNFLIRSRTPKENYEWLSYMWSGIEV